MTLFRWTAQHVEEALGLPRGAWDHEYTGVTTDTRAMKDGDLFVALQGERFDGHDYLGDARIAGVRGAVVRKGTPRWPGIDWFEVDDTLDALGALARWRRDQFAGRVVAITGTVGKTSTKELTAAALSPLGPVHRSEKNLNNLVGVPLTILAAPVEAKAWVVECGASVRGEIPRMQQIVRPDIAVVTAVDAGHLEGFGSLDAVMEEKTSLLRGAAVAVVGTHPPALAETARRLTKNVVVAGTGQDVEWTAREIDLLPDARTGFSVRGAWVELPVPGRHMVGNALIALAVADAAGVPLAAAAEAIRTASLPGGRSAIREIGGTTVIDDTYNANPASLRAALDLMNAVKGESRRRTVAVIGTMRELGAESARLHREVAQAVVAAHPSLIVAIGEFAPAFGGLDMHQVPLIAGATPEAVAPQLKARLQPGDVILLKASRGVALERIIPLLWPGAAPAEGAH